MTTPHPLPLQAARFVTRVALHGLRRAERALARTARTLDEQHGPHGRLVLNVVDDPTAQMRLIGVRGYVIADTVGPLAEAFAAVPNGTSLHLDLTDAILAGPTVLEHVEMLIDQLERRHVRIRIVGLDPRHPALSAKPLR